MDKFLIYNAKIWRSGEKHIKNGCRIYSWMLFNQNDGIIKECGVENARPNLKVVGKAVDMGGKWVFPGFHDSHIHLHLHGKYNKSGNLSKANSIKDLQKNLNELLEKSDLGPSEWFCSGAWDQESLGRYPTAHDLDAVTTSRPVLLYQVSYHTCVVNSLAMKICGIDENTVVMGGEIERYPDDHEFAGHPTGILKEESAIALVKQMIPRSSKQIKQELSIAMQDCLENGHTSVHGLDRDCWNEIAELADDNQLLMPCFFSIFYEDFEGTNRPKICGESHGDKIKCECRCVKIFADGALGCKTAALSIPYISKTVNEMNNYGILFYTQEELNQVVERIKADGFQLEIHVIGDKAAEYALNALEYNNIQPSSRPIFVHCQILSDSLVKRMKKHGVVASIQPQMVTGDSRWVRDILPNDLRSCIYPWKTLLDNEIVCAGGSDSPIDLPDPLLGIYDAIFQPDESREKGHGSFQGSERVTFSQAVDMYTADAAYMDFAEEKYGRLEPGYYASFVVLDVPETEGKIIDLPHHPEALLETRVKETWVMGVKKFDRSKDCH